MVRRCANITCMGCADTPCTNISIANCPGAKGNPGNGKRGCYRLRTTPHLDHDLACALRGVGALCGLTLLDTA